MELVDEFWQKLTGFVKSGDSKYSEDKHGLVYTNYKPTIVAVCTPAKWCHLIDNKNRDNSQELVDILLKRRDNNQPLNDIEILVHVINGVPQYIKFRYCLNDIRKPSKEDLLEVKKIKDFGTF